MTTKTTMPGPQLIVDFCENADLHVWEAGNERSSGVVRSANRGEYITTTQAEAYANGRVRGALEEAAMILKANAEVCHSDTAIILRSNAEAIRALIPTTK